MKFIAHRGNMNGPNPKEENSPEYIQKCLDLGYDAEIDIRISNGELWSGHDKPQYKVSLEFLKNPKIYIHSKTIETLAYFVSLGLNTFFHDTDDATLTSKGEIWTYPNKTLTPLSICVMPELNPSQIIPSNIKGICSDYDFPIAFILLSCAPIDHLTLQLKSIRQCVSGRIIVVINTLLDLSLIPPIPDMVIFRNSVHVKVIPHHSGFHRAFASCYNVIKNYIFSHVVFMSSNEMYFRKGVKEHICKNNLVNYQHANTNIFQTESPYYVNCLRSILFQKTSLDYVISGQWEGTFIPKSTMDKIIENYGDLWILYDNGPNSCEETILPSLIVNLHPEIRSRTIQTHCTKVYYDVKDLEAPVSDLSLIEQYSIKRVKSDTQSRLSQMIQKELAI